MEQESKLRCSDVDHSLQGPEVSATVEGHADAGETMPVVPSEQETTAAPEQYIASLRQVTDALVLKLIAEKAKQEGQSAQNKGSGPTKRD